MHSSELFSHREHQQTTPDAEHSIDPDLIFSHRLSDRPIPHADAQPS